MPRELIMSREYKIAVLFFLFFFNFFLFFVYELGLHEGVVPNIHQEQCT
jgi:hypothetical protein